MKYATVWGRSDLFINTVIYLLLFLEGFWKKNNFHKNIKQHNCLQHMRLSKTSYLDILTFER